MVDRPEAESIVAKDDVERRAFFDDLRSSGLLEHFYEEFRKRRTPTPEATAAQRIETPEGFSDVARIELRLSAVENRLGQVETRLAVLETKLTTVDARLETVEVSIRELRNQDRTDFRLLFGALIAVAFGLAGLMAKGFHWI